MSTKPQRTLYSGMDTSDYPGDDAMRYLMKHTSLHFCGFYLDPAPSHPSPRGAERSWMPKKAFLRALGWGLMPLYVGRQLVKPGAVNPSTTTGRTDGAGTASLMLAAGFEPRSRVFLDLENGLMPSALMSPELAYVKAWAATVREAGFTPAVYCSFQVAPQVHVADPSLDLWVFHVPSVATHTVTGRSYPAPDPGLSGYAGAKAWQFADACKIDNGNGGQLLVDLDSSVWADPSRDA